MLVRLTSLAVHLAQPSGYRGNERFIIFETIFLFTRTSLFSVLARLTQHLGDCEHIMGLFSQLSNARIQFKVIIKTVLVEIRLALH